MMLIDETSNGICQKFELWISIVGIKWFRMSRSKTEYMYFKFSKHTKSEIEVELGRIVVPKCRQFKYVDLNASGEWYGK